MTDIQLPEQAVARRADAGQATQIEQSRAIAEVQGAIIVAQQVPRSMPAALAMLRESCAQKALADRAFFRYNRAGSQVTGPTVHLAREVARCFGNVQHGIVELSRDDAAGESQMQAWAWDVQTNVRSSTTFINKHRRDKTGVVGGVLLTETRDIYEMNANMGARRLREMIFSIVPAWFTEEAKDLCTATLRNDGGSGKTLAQRTADLIARFATLGVNADQLEQRQGRESSKWTDMDLATLGVIGKSLVAGEATVEEEFPTVRVTADEIRKQREPDVKAAASTPDPDPEPDWARIEADQAAARAEAEQTPAPTNGASVEFITPKQMPMLQALMNSRGVRDQGKRHRILSNMVSRELASTKELTKAEATTVIDTIEQMTPEAFTKAFGDI